MIHDMDDKIYRLLEEEELLLTQISVLNAI